jgi:hypothetical protein
VLVVEGDRILLDRGYGSADLDWSIPNAPDVKLRLGSPTKQFTATLILLFRLAQPETSEPSASRSPRRTRPELWHY